MEEGSRKIGFEINAISNMLKRKAPKLRSSLTKMQMWIIGYIFKKKDGDVFQGELERTFHITRATASDILKRMERDGLIARTGVPYDARRKKITLTKDAEEIADTVGKRIELFESIMAKDISEEDLTVFFRVVDQIKINLRNSLDE